MVNDDKPRFVVEQVRQIVGADSSAVIGCLGLSYKADVDDFRESPSLEIVRRLQDTVVGEVLSCDPYASPQTCPDVTLTPLEELLQRSDIVLLLTDHASFRALSATDLAGKRVIDTRGVWPRNTDVTEPQRAAQNVRRAA